MNRENKTKKIETYGYNFRSLWFTKCSIIFSTPQAWFTPAIIIQENNYSRSFGWFGKSRCLWCRCREKNLQCRMTDMGVWGQSPQPPEAKGSALPPPSVWLFLLFFNKINTFLGIFGIKFLLQNIFLISSIIQNGRRSRHESAEEQNI